MPKIYIAWEHVDYGDSDILSVNESFAGAEGTVLAAIDASQCQVFRKSNTFWRGNSGSWLIESMELEP